MLVRKGELKLSEVNLKNKNETIQSLEDGRVNLDNNHRSYESLFNDTKDELKSIKEDILLRAEEFTKELDTKHRNKIFDRLICSEVILFNFSNTILLSV